MVDKVIMVAVTAGAMFDHNLSDVVSGVGGFLVEGGVNGASFLGGGRKGVAVVDVRNAEIEEHGLALV